MVICYYSNKKTDIPSSYILNCGLRYFLHWLSMPLINVPKILTSLWLLLLKYLVEKKWYFVTPETLFCALLSLLKCAYYCFLHVVICSFFIIEHSVLTDLFFLWSLSLMWCVFIFLCQLTGNSTGDGIYICLYHWPNCAEAGRLSVS